MRWRDGTGFATLIPLLSASPDRPARLPLDYHSLAIEIVIDAMRTKPSHWPYNLFYEVAGEYILQVREFCEQYGYRYSKNLVSRLVKRDRGRAGVFKLAHEFDDDAELLRTACGMSSTNATTSEWKGLPEVYKQEMLVMPMQDEGKLEDIRLDWGWLEDAAKVDQIIAAVQKRRRGE